MARRLVSVMGRVKGGPTRGGSTRSITIYDDEALTTPSTLYARSSGAQNQPNPIVPNSGKQVFLTADRGAGDAFVIVTDVAPFHVGDLIPIYDAVNTVYKVITVITPATKRLDLDQTLGFAFAAATAKVDNPDMEGHLWFYVDDARDYFAQVSETSSGRKLPPLQFPVRAPTSPIDVMEEGTLIGNRPRINFIGATITAVDDAGNNRFNVTVAAGPDNASYVTTASETGLSNEQVLGTAVILSGTLAGRPAASMNGRLYLATDDNGGTFYRDTGAAWVKVAAPVTHAAQHNSGGADAMAIDAAAATGSLRTLGTAATQAAPGTVDAAAGTGSVRTLGTGATQAAAGNHAHTPRVEAKAGNSDASGNFAPTWTTAFGATPVVVGAPNAAPTDRGANVTARSTTGATVNINLGAGNAICVIASDAT